MREIRQLRSQHGTSTVEMVVVLPTLLLVLFAIAEISRAWFTLNIVTTAAREGARAGSVSGAAPNAAVDRATAILASANLIPTAAVMNCIPAPCAPDSQVQVSVTVSFETVIPLLQIIPALAGPFNIAQTASMRHE